MKGPTFLATIAAVVLVVGLAAAQPASAADRRGPERQPHMVAALKHLRAARDELEHAEHDKGGHRAAAIKLVEQAMSEVKEGAGFDNTH